MNNRKTLLLIIFLLLILLLVGSVILYQQLSQSVDMEDLTPPQQTEETAEKNQAPDFTVYDIDGNEVHLSDYFGKPIVLNFWASWCGPCQMEMPHFQEKYSALGEDVTFLMVNMTDGSRETVETASEFIAENQYSFPVFYDTQMDAALAYGAYSLPTTYFIDADGSVVTHAIGAIDAQTLQDRIDMIQ